MIGVFYQGFISLGGVELANAARTEAYAQALVPGLDVTDCTDCEDLAEVLGDKPYTTPFVDAPEWFDANNPDSWDFCGFYPLQIDGMDDGTREATVTELAVDGAVVGAPRYRSREIRVSGLLIGASPAAVQHGLTWLTSALEGAPCRSEPGCTGDHLCYYAACPQMCSDSPDLDPGGQVLATNLGPNPRGSQNPGQGWAGGGVNAGWPKGYAAPGEGLVTEAEFVPDSPDQVGFQYTTAPVDATGAVNAIRSVRTMDAAVTAGQVLGARMYIYAPQDPSSSLRLQLRGAWRDANGASTLGPDFAIEEIQPTEGGWVLMSGLTPPVPAGAVSLSVFPWWVVRSGETIPPVLAGQTVAWAARIITEGEVPDRFFDGDTPDAGPVVYEWTGPAPMSASQMVTADQLGEPFWLCDSGPIDPEQDWARLCSVDYERTLYQVTTTSGPTVVERYNSHCAALLRVEFTMVAGVPWAYSTPVLVAPTDTNPIPAPTTVDEIACVQDDDGLPLRDPDCPVVPAPPRPPVIDVACVDTPDQWSRYEIVLDGSRLPPFRDAVPIIELTTGSTAARQVRVRFYANPFGFDVDQLDPCSFCGEFVVTYIPANATMTIDGIRQQATVDVVGGAVFTANHLMAATDGGPVQWPVLGCGVSYSMVVDVSPTGVDDLTTKICFASRTA